MRILVAIVILLGFGACKKIDKLTEFDIDYTETVTIPSSTGISLPFNLYSPNVETNSESTFEVNDTRKDLIEAINLKQLTLTILSPNGADFSFLESITIYLNAEGLNETKLAYLDDVTANAGHSINLVVSNTDFKEYIKKDEIALRVNTVTDETIAQDHQIKVYTLFHVDAKILGR